VVGHIERAAELDARWDRYPRGEAVVAGGDVDRSAATLSGLVESRGEGRCVVLGRGIGAEVRDAEELAGGRTGVGRRGVHGYRRR